LVGNQDLRQLVSERHGSHEEWSQHTSSIIRRFPSGTSTIL
jgi:hypothetical protein